MINKIEEQEKKEKASLFLQCEALFVDPDARKKIDELFEKEYQDFTKKVSKMLIFFKDFVYPR